MTRWRARTAATRSCSTRPGRGCRWADYRKGELRFRALAAAQPAEAERLLGLAQQVVDLRWRPYEEMATRGASEFPSDPAEGS